MKHLLKLTPILAFGLLASCVSTTRPDQITPQVSSSTRTGAPITVNAMGGSEKTPLGGPGVTNENLKTAIETSIVNSGLFSKVGGGGYSLEALIVEISQPVMGFNMTTEVEIDYRLRRGSSSVWQKSIKSSHTATVGEAFAGVERVRVSTEGAVRKNISQAINQMSARLR